MNYWIAVYGIVVTLILIPFLISGIRPNWFLKAFVHVKNSPDHPVTETYTGMSVIGYTCNKCKYSYYLKRNKNKKTTPLTK
jgi:hypothetical protein